MSPTLHFFTTVLSFRKCNVPLFPLFFILCLGQRPSSRFRLRADYGVLKKARPLQIAAFVSRWKLVNQFLGFAKYQHFQCKLCFVIIILKCSPVFHPISRFSSMSILFCSQPFFSTLQNQCNPRVNIVYMIFSGPLKTWRLYQLWAFGCRLPVLLLWERHLIDMVIGVPCSMLREQHRRGI